MAYRNKIDYTERAVNDRFRDAVIAIGEKYEITKKEICLRIGIYDTHLKDYIKMTRKIKPEIVSAMNTAFGVSEEWMLMGDGAMFDKENLSLNKGKSPNMVIKDFHNKVEEPITEYKKTSPMTKDKEELYQEYILTLKQTIAEHLRTIADLRRDAAIDAQKKTIEVQEDRIEELEERLSIDKPEREATKPGFTFKKGKESTTSEKAVSNDKGGDKNG